MSFSIRASISTNFFDRSERQCSRCFWLWFVSFFTQIQATKRLQTASGLWLKANENETVNNSNPLILKFLDKFYKSFNSLWHKLVAFLSCLQFTWKQTCIFLVLLLLMFCFTINLCYDLCVILDISVVSHTAFIYLFLLCDWCVLSNENIPAMRLYTHVPHTHTCTQPHGHGYRIQINSHARIYRQHHMHAHTIHTVYNVYDKHMFIDILFVYCHIIFVLAVSVSDSRYFVGLSFVVLVFCRWCRCCCIATRFTQVHDFNNCVSVCANVIFLFCVHLIDFWDGKPQKCISLHFSFHFTL